MESLRYPFIPFQYAIEMNNDARTVTVHRAEKPCFPPRGEFFNRIARWFGGGKEQAAWTLAPSIEDARTCVDGLNETIAGAFGGVLPPYRFRVCLCARWQAVSQPLSTI